MNISKEIVIEDINKYLNDNIDLIKARISGDEKDDNFTELEFYDENDNIDFVLNYKKNKPCFQLLIIDETRYLFKHMYKNKNSTNIEIYTKGELVLDTWDKEFNNHIRKAAEELISTFTGDEVANPVEEDVSATNKSNDVDEAIANTLDFIINEKTRS